MKYLFATIIFCSLFLFPTSNTTAQELYNDYQGTYKAEVINIGKPESREIWDGTESQYKNINIELLSGPGTGDVITIESDFPNIKEGQKIFINHIKYINGEEVYSITNIDRTNQIYFFIGLFALAVVWLGGKQGLKSLLSLGVSFLTIIYILLPGILKGWDPFITSSLVAGAILFVAIFLTHGFNRESTIAYSGTIIAVIFTGLLAMFAVYSTSLTGYASDESVYLNFSTKGMLDFSGLLLGAIIIGALGVLDDIAITQSAIVSELFDSNKNMPRREAFKRAMRIGREHVSALVNTLVLAYTGASLPLLLLLKTQSHEITSIINSEILATEIIRTIVGSIGLIITVPIVTVLAVYFLRNSRSKHPEHQQMKPSVN